MRESPQRFKRQTRRPATGAGSAPITRLDIATLCAHAGVPEPPEAGDGGRAHVTPLYQTSVFDFATIADSRPALAGEGYVYARNGLPNADELGAAVAALEGAAAGVGTSAGMGAITALVLAFCAAGDRVLVQRDAYGGTLSLLQKDLARFEVDVVPVDVYDHEAFARAFDGVGKKMSARRVAMALVETVSNPLLREVDVGALATMCRQFGTTLVCDNTFATPLRDRPLERGAALVVHSATKFLGGHGDLSAGAVVGDRARVDMVRGAVVRMGLNAAPMDAWLAVRGLRTLDVRMQRAWATAELLAERLRAHPAVHAVHSARRCALVTVDLGSEPAAARFVERLQLVTLSPSLGSVTTTASHPASSSHKDVPPETRAAIGIGDGLVRLSIGIEAASDVWADIERALAA
jgi:cystathionine beta-lyase/cystathionine gamma-synthase